MNIMRAVGVALVAVGVVLILFGINATGTFGEELREAFAGRYSDAVMWYLVGGAALVGGGAALVVLGRPRPRAA